MPNTSKRLPAESLRNAVREWLSADAATEFFGRVIETTDSDDGPEWPVIEFSVPSTDSRSMVKVMLDPNTLASSKVQQDLAKALVAAVADSYDASLSNLKTAAYDLREEREDIGYPYYKSDDD